MIRELVQQQFDAFAALGHPDVIGLFVLRNGVERIGSPLPDGIRKMRAKACFENAALISMRRGLTYCEGLAVRVDLPILIHHAWCIDKDGKVIDPTWSAPETAHYMGVEFTARQLANALRDHHVYGLFDTGVRINLELMVRMDPGIIEEINAHLKTRSRLLDALSKDAKAQQL